MPPALICDAGVVTNPSTTITALAAGAASTFTVRNFPFSSRARLVELTRQGATAGIVRVRSPYFIDDVQGIRYGCTAGLESFLTPRKDGQRLTTQDALTIEVTGGASENDGAMISTYYDDLPGSAMKLKMPGDIFGMAEYYATWEVNVTSGTAAAWAGTALTNLYDVSRANRWYAVLGYVTDVACLGVAINGPDTSNFNVGGPGDTVARRTRSYFVEKSEDLGVPCIPCFNTANKGATTLQATTVAASAATPNVSLVIAAMPATWQA